MIIFDVDGVIIDSFDIIYEGVLNFIESHGGMGVTQNQFRGFFDGNALAKTLRAASISDASAIPDRELHSLYGDYQRTKVFPGMVEVLKQLAKKHTLIVITSTAIELVFKRFEALDIHDLFAAFLGPKAGVNKKTKVQMALDEFGSDTDSVYFISDTLGDLLEVKDMNGLKLIAATWGYQERAKLELATPDFYADKPQDLLKILSS